jgi:L-fuculose-phosphate aldolase
MLPSLDPEQTKRQMCDIGRRLWQRAFVAANDGNISVRIDHRRILVTPTGVSKGFMVPEIICIVGLDGRTLVAPDNYRPTSELPMHLAIYRHRPDVQAVVHTHAPHAVAFAITGHPLPRDIYPEVEVLLGEVPLAPYAVSGTDEVPASVTPLITPDTRALLMANHGPVTFGPSLQSAYDRMEVLEAYCRIVAITRSIGEARQVPTNSA